MTATDTQGNKLILAALFNQVGPVVTANSFSAFGNANLTSPCVPFSASFSSGLVANVNLFTGTISSAFGALSFTGTLNDAGTAVNGTYTIANLNGCGGIGASGIFTGAEVPSVTGNWTGTLQQCNFDQQIGKCTSNIGAPSAVTFNLTQNDATGNVTGTYQVANMAGFSNGSVSVIPPSDILSGLALQFSMADANGSNFVTNGTLGMDKSFAGVLAGKANAVTHNNVYALTMSH
jgi:hypothetical protein